MTIRIDDPEAIALMHKLAKLRGMTVDEAVKLAVRNCLNADAAGELKPDREPD